MSYSLHPGAEHDVADALNFYKQSAGPVIAARFLEEFERVAKFLVAHPDPGSPTIRRRCLHYCGYRPSPAVLRHAAQTTHNRRALARESGPRLRA